jgi:hypothetical protein
VPRAPSTLGLSAPSSPRPGLAQFALPAVPRSIDNPRGLFSRDPSIPVGGLFGWDPDPTSPFAGAPFGAGGGITWAPIPGVPRAPSTLGLSAPPSLAQVSPALDSSNSLPASLHDASVAPASPTQSMLFNRPPTTWDFGARDRDLAKLGRSGQTLGLSDLPISKSGTPYVSPPPQLSITREQWLNAARLAAPNTVVTGPYGKLSGTLPPGFQAHHLNQNAVYRKFIPRTKGLSVGIRGNILTEPGTPHYIYHRSMEQFWDQYRDGGSLEFTMPTNAEYAEASRRALIASGLSPQQASEVAARAAAQRTASGLSESAPVPEIPIAIWRRRRN